MIDFVSALLVAFGVVFVAELGDKTQLLALGFGARYSLRIVAVGLTAGYAIANVLATTVGGVLGAALPERPIQIASGLIFGVFAALALREVLDDRPSHDRDDRDDSEDGDDRVQDTTTRTRTRQGRLAVVGSMALTIAIAEMGDKTQISTATLASQSSPAGVWLGATLGAASSGMIGALLGRTLGDRIPMRAVHLLSAALFAGFGVAMLAGWF